MGVSKMSIGLDEIVINTRSGVLHTKNCEAVKQMKESNKKLAKVNNLKQLQSATHCGHCLKKRDLKQLYTDEYDRRRNLLIKRRERDHRYIDQKYAKKLEKLDRIYAEQMQGLED